MICSLSDSLARMASKNPERYFSRPLDVVSDMRIDRDQKRKILEKWRLHRSADLVHENDTLIIDFTSSRSSAQVLQEIFQAERYLET